MRHIYTLLFTCFLTFISCHFCGGQQLYTIPKQIIYPFKILGTPSPENTWGQENGPDTMKLDMDSFEISKLITYGEYKEYLELIKKDSSAKFYSSQLPDTLMCLPEIYKEYTTGTKYDKYPVMGISWDAAMNYCRWETIQNNKDTIKYIYRLPCKSEWLDAYQYLNAASIKNDFSQNYSDWLLNIKDESTDLINTASNILWHKFDDVSIENNDAPKVLRRKSVIGDSYLFKMQTLADYGQLYGYSFQGYRQIGFRFIREIVYATRSLNKKTLTKSNKSTSYILNGDDQIILIWGLNYSKR